MDAGETKDNCKLLVALIMLLRVIDLDKEKRVNDKPSASNIQLLSATYRCMKYKNGDREEIEREDMEFKSRKDHELRLSLFEN